MLSGYYYQKVKPKKNTTTFSYKLLVNEPVALTYSHLVLSSKFVMLPCKSSKSNPRFQMSPQVRQRILDDVEGREAYRPT